MGWASGSGLLANVIMAVKVELDCGGKDKIRFYKRLIEAFEDHDCDTLDECRDIDPLFDNALDQLHPPEDD
jgi:hypothetical protein